MNKKRAMDIFVSKTKVLEIEPVTEEEDKYIRLVWSYMPAWTSYEDAVLKIAMGNLPVSMQIDRPE